MYSVGPVDEASRMKEEEDSRRGREGMRDEGDKLQGAYRGNSSGNTATSSCTLYTYITVYAEETKPLAENVNDSRYAETATK